MNRPQPFLLCAFGDPGDPLVGLDRGARQVQYLRCYLHDVGARSLLVEPNYFDRDYLSEFEAFYATSSAGYPNICQRVHYFDQEITRAMLVNAAGGEPADRTRVERAYLGHIILRPIPGAPIGRTVLRAYPDDTGVAAGQPRIMEPAREYVAHVAGLTLRVSGLAWQQQDSAVGACATVALWSMLHSSAFDDHHAIPTTAKITSVAHGSVPLGNRIFPADAGLQTTQILEVIKSHDLAPVLIPGDLENSEFSRRQFCTLIASFIRSGYPVLVSGWLQDTEPECHTVCVTGFRAPRLAEVPNGKCLPADEDIEFLYIHDDNLGPNARFRVVEDHGTISLMPSVSEPLRGARPTGNPMESYFEIVPTDMMVAVHDELRTDPIELQRAAMNHAAWLPETLDYERERRGGQARTGMTVSSRFMRQHRYLADELASVLRDRPPTVRGEARLALCEAVAPMSLHLGVVRVSLGLEPMVDILFDTSDSNRHLRPIAHVAFQQQVPWLLKRWRTRSGEELDLGTPVRAW